jgi:S-DNA-T family DNA segregation ATPase FtsK/SpoIIIE
MILLLTVETHSEGRRWSADARVAIDGQHTVHRLKTSLEQWPGLRHRAQAQSSVLHLLRTGRWIPLHDNATIGAVGLTSGDRILLAPNATHQLHEAAEGSSPDRLRLVVTSGLDAGRALELREGYHVVGTNDHDDLILSDPKLSHQGDFGIDVAEDGTITVDPGPRRTNPLRVNGTGIDRPIVIGPGDLLRVGATGLAIRPPIRVREYQVDEAGSVPFNRTPQFREPVPETTFDPLGIVPVKPKPRRFHMLAALAPLITGIGMAVILGSPRFLLFSVMSPIIAVGNHFDARRQGGRDYEQATEQLDVQIKRRRGEVDRALSTERQVRNRNAPDTLELVERAEVGDKRIWNRGRRSDEFLRLRFGDGTIRPRMTIKPETAGDDDLRRKVAAAFTGCDQLIDMPVTVDVGDDHVVALVGDRSETTALASSLIIQAATLHSPEDLIVAAAMTEESAVPDWAKWLPHTRSRNSPLARSHLACDAEQADDLLREVTQVAEVRALSGDRSFDPRWPRILLVLDAGLGPDPGTTSRLMDLAEPAGVSVLFLCRSERDVPRQGQAIASLREPGQTELSMLTFVAPDRNDRMFEPARLPADVAERAARRLAPLRDISAANAVAGVPTTVTLFDALRRQDVDAGWIAEQWLTERGYALPAPIGLADNGPVVLDFVKHGPHGLIGGTSGAGKSELVQSLVGNLIALNSPERVNILFVDYKGGALSGLFEGVPHEVGAVTNLSPLLSQRALISLRAELDRRMKLFADHDVTDLRGMLEAHPDSAPASLVIVVDEFATLKRELPEFVQGVVSIAERGRSLGIHLLLSTQRPSGSIDENIKQNTNLRISLRMLDSGESNDVIGTPDAASIPNHLKGRGFARLGPGEMIAFQSAWSAAPLRPEEGLPPVLVEPFAADDAPLARPQRPREDPGDTSATNQTQLEALLEAVADASEKLGLERGRVPWKEPLPALMSLTTILADPRAPVDDDLGVITFGMKDDPAGQDQYPATVDLRQGCLVIFGGAASGKTTALTTMACSAALRDSERGGGLTIIGFDHASRQLGVLNRLPQSLPVANGDDLEATTRYIALLEERFDQRRARMAAAVDDLDAPDPEFAPILVVVDGFEMLADTFSSNLIMQRWLDRLTQVATRGREVGIYTVVTTSSFSGPSGRLANTTGNRLVLRQSDENGYRAFGLRSGVVNGLDLAAGQAMNLAGDLLQIAAVCDPPGPNGQLRFDPEAIGRLELAGSVAEECRTEPLPKLLTGNTVGSRRKGEVEIGVADLSLAPVVIDVLLNGLVVYGPPRSGRSTALATVARQLTGLEADLWVIGSRSSPLQELSLWTHRYFGRQRGLSDYLAELKIEAESFPDRLRFLIVDDANQIDDMSLNKPLQEIVNAEVVCLGSALDTRSLAMSPLHKELKAARSLLFLRADDENGIQAAAGSRVNVRPGLAMRPGRGLLVTDGRAITTQIRSRADSS